jgi:hypothetical protein
MSKRVSGGGSSGRSGRGNSSAVAGAQEIRIAGDASGIRGAPNPPAACERSWGHSRRAGQQRRRLREEQRWTSIDDLSDPIPLTERELDVIETYLGSLLDDFLNAHPAA